jgi:SnoaL-like domain
MTPDVLWKRYAAVWSLTADQRVPELAACLADDVTYCDPNGLITGRPALSEYIGQFQHSVPGGQFHVRFVLHHHDRSLAHWALHAPGGDVLQIGTSFGMLAQDGRLRSVSGFFHTPDVESPA